MSDLSDFIEHDIEGYLFHDILAMQAATEKPGETGGGLGYPLLMTSLSGIELLGALLSQKVFNTFSGDTYFRRYWREFLYPTQIARAAACDAVYKLARHGIAHAFLLKGPLLVTKGSPAHHLTIDSQGQLYIDATQLSSDLMESYNQRIKPFLSSPTASVDPASMSLRLKEIAKSYSDDAAKPIATFQAAGPPSGPTGATIEGSGGGPGYVLPSSAVSQSFGSGPSGPRVP